MTLLDIAIQGEYYDIYGIKIFTVTTGNQSSVRTKKSLSSHSRNARKTVIWVPDEYLHQTGQKDRLCSS